MTEQPQPAAGQPQEAPAPSVPWQPGMKRELTPDQLTAWQGRLDRSERKAKLFHPQWERGLTSYAQARVDEKRKAEISALLPYRHVESKKSQLFHRTPEINLLPVDPQDQAVPYDAILPLREKFLNHELGCDGADMKRALHKTLIDTLAASGWMATEIGFEQVTLPVPADPMTGVAPTNPDGTPVVVPVWSRRFVEAISSMRVRVPDDFHDTDFDKAPWLGVKGTIALAKAKKAGWYLPDGFEGNTSAHEARFKHDLPDESSSDAQVHYTKIWYRASEYDDAVFNPELFRCLIVVEGCEHPAWHVDSPFQEMTPQGQLTDDSLIGNPIHIDTIRDLIDSAYVPSDLAVGEQLSEEVNRFRTGLARGRHKRQPVTVVNAGLGQDHITKIAENSGPVVLPEEFFDGAGNQRAVAIVQAGTEPRDNYTAQEKIEQDWEQALGTSPNQAGNFNRTKRTATEVRQVAGNSSARAETDKDRVREYVIKLVRKFDAIVQRTATQQEIVKVLGQQGAMLYQQWQKLPGRYAYKIQPDSGQYIDAHEYRQFALQKYELLRKDDVVNAVELVKSTVRALGEDAAKLVVTEAPEPKPDQPKVSISFNAEQALVNPAEMQLLLSIMKQHGYHIPPEMEGALMAVSQLRQATAAMQETAPNPEHGGPAGKVERINKHQEQKTGGIQGVGSAA